VGSVDLQLARDLFATAGVRRAVETGTFRGVTARSLAGVFSEVVTIELSPELHRSAAERLRDVPAVRALQGDSTRVLREVADPATPTLFFLDGHWSGGKTAGAEAECPVLEEIAAIGAGHPHDCLLIDDAPLFQSAPPPPHDPALWPTLTEVFDAIRAQRPDHFVTLLADQVLAVPPQARPAVDRYGQRLRHSGRAKVDRAWGLLQAARNAVRS
jgi:hypothetical protein